jgi:pSer/pThr/pTyr-binding forkhead associated (FHA) protein
VNDPNELLALRIGLLAVIFVFVLVTAVTLQAGVRGQRTATRRRAAAATPDQAPARLTLLVPGRTGLAAGTEFAVAGDMTIGREPANSIVLADPSVSAQHAILEATRDGWQLVDLGSTNGTAVNGRPVDGRGRMLAPGDQVSLGTVVLRFQA